MEEKILVNEQSQFTALWVSTDIMLKVRDRDVYITIFDGQVCRDFRIYAVLVIFLGNWNTAQLLYLRIDHIKPIQLIGLFVNILFLRIFKMNIL